MKKGIIRLLVGLLALSAAWDLVQLSAALKKETQRQDALNAAAAELEEAASQLKNELSALDPEASASGLLRQRGFISKDDIVFFDGG